MPPENKLSPHERDLIIRTVIGESGNQSPEGQAAVAHVILNRVRDGSFGDNASRVILAPNAFEPWSTRAGELATIPRNSKPYQQIGEIVDRVHSGEIPDPTSGATHFLQEEIVRQRRGGTLPQWAQGPGQRIGAHTFFNPNQKTAMNNTPDYLTIFSEGSQPETEKAVPKGKETADYLTDFLNAKTEQAPASPSTLNQPQMIGNRPVDEIDLRMTPRPADAAPASELMDRTIRPLADIPSGLRRIGGDYADRTMQLFNENAGLVGQGLSSIRSGKSAAGVGETALGALGYLFSPVQAIDKPIEKLTGNKSFGEKAAMLVPTSGTGKLVNAARPTVNALKDVVRDIGSENLPQIIARMESNPKLTLMDVAPAVRGNAAGLATDPRNVPAMTHLSDFQRERMAARKSETLNAFEDVLGPTPNVKKTVDELKEAAVKTGKEKIEPAIATARPVDVSSVVQNLDKQLPPEMVKALKETGRYEGPMSDVDKRIWSLRQRLGGETKTIDPQRAHELQMELRRNSSDPQLGFQARQVRRELVDAIDQATLKEGQKTGTYKSALKEYAGDKQVEEAFKHGFDIFSNPTNAEKSLANHPDVWKAWAEDASKAELEAVKKGILLGAHSRVANMRKSIDIPEGSFTHERISAIVGEKEANKIVKTLNDWRDISATDNLLTQNSATALRQAGQANRAVPDARSTKDILSSLAPGAIVGGAAHLVGGQNPILTGAMTLAGIAGGKLADVAKKSHAISSNTAYAQWASATGQKKEDLLAILREAAARNDPASSGQKLMNLAPSSILQALPR